MAPYLPRPQVGPGGMKPLAGPKPPGAFGRPAVGNFSPNDLGVGILTAPQASVVGAPKLGQAPGVPRTRRAVMGKMKATLRPKRPKIPKAGDQLSKIQLAPPNLGGNNGT